MLHTTAVLLEAFVVTAIFIRSMQQVESFENIVRQRMATLCFTQWLTWPALPSLQTSVKFTKSGNELRLLLFEHLDVASSVSS